MNFFTQTKKCSVKVPFQEASYLPFDETIKQFPFTVTVIWNQQNKLIANSSLFNVPIIRCAKNLIISYILWFTFCTSVGSSGFLYSNSSPTLYDMSMGMMLDLKEKQWNGPSALMHNLALLSDIILSANPDGAPKIERLICCFISSAKGYYSFGFSTTIFIFVENDYP